MNDQIARPLAHKYLELTEEMRDKSEQLPVSKHSFDRFYSRFLLYFNKRLELLLRKAMDNGKLLMVLPNMIGPNLESMLEELRNISIRTLIYDINEMRLTNRLEGNTPSSRYDYYNRLFENDDVFVAFFNNYPLLLSLMDQRMECRLDLVEEVLRRLAEDQVEISQLKGQECTVIDELSITSGDTHNQGRKVLRIHTDAGYVIYKPHSLSTDLLFNRLIDLINGEKTLRYDINYLTCIDKGDYGWQTYAEQSPCRTELEVQQYYYRLGVILSLLYAIGTTDIHFENLICTGANPFIIDLETLIENKSFAGPPSGDSLVYEFNRTINESVLGTAVLPLHLKHSLFDFDISAMSTSEAQTSSIWKVYVILNDYTDKIKLEKRPGIISSASNSVYLNESIVEPYLYIEDLIEGFEHSYHIFLNNKQKYTAFLLDHCRHNIKIRQVLRPTSIYARFLEASTHPNYLRAIQDRINLLSKIHQNHKEVNFDQLQEEISSLVNHDIPYFTTTMTSTDIVCNKDKILLGFFQSSLAEILKNRLERISLKDLESQLYYIRLSLSTSVRNNWLKDGGDDFERLNSYIPYFKRGGSYLEHAVEVGEFLRSTAIWNHEKTACTWFVQLIDKERLKLGALNYLLYEGGGALIFLMQLAKETGNPDYEQLVQAGMRAFEPQMDNLQTQTPILSAFNGIGSLIYLHYVRYTLFRNIEAHARYDELIGNLMDSNLEIHSDHLDYATGVSGLIVLLLNIYEVEEDHRLLNLSKRLGEQLYEKLSLEEGMITGLSHGSSGYILALVKLFALTKSPKFGRLAAELLTWENSHYDERRRNWADLRDGEHETDPAYWCHGAPGIVLARANLLLYPNVMDRDLLEEDIRRGTLKLVEDGFSKKLDHSLCHGIFGNVDILLSISKLTNNSTLLQLAYEQTENALEHIRLKRVVCGLNNAFDMISFMVGLTGIGYAFLRLHNPDIPSVLSLETGGKRIASSH